MWIQVKNEQGEWENRIAAEGTMAQAHLERLTAIYGATNVRPSPSTVKEQAFACGCQRTLVGTLGLCPGHGAEFSRRREATHKMIADEIEGYVRSQGQLTKEAKIALAYWANRIRRRGH
jgi:hypothetical protein